MRKRFRPITIPSEFNLMNQFLESKKLECTEHVVASIEYAHNRKMDHIQLFEFENTDYVISLNSSTFNENLDNIYDYYIDSEQYEYCNRLLEVKKLINTKDTNEQKKNSKRYKSEGSTKPKNTKRSSNKNS